MIARKAVGLCPCLRLAQHLCSHSWSPFEVSFCQSRLTESREEPTMNPESPSLEDGYTGRQGNESWEEPPRFRQHAFPGTVLTWVGLSIEGHALFARIRRLVWVLSTSGRYRADSRPTRGFHPASSSVNSLRRHDARARSNHRRAFPNPFWLVPSFTTEMSLPAMDSARSCESHP